MASAGGRPTRTAGGGAGGGVGDVECECELVDADADDAGRAATARGAAGTLAAVLGWGGEGGGRGSVCGP